MTRIIAVPLNAKTVEELMPAIKLILEELQTLRQKTTEQEKLINELKSKL